jgi:hypothetical protein
VPRRRRIIETYTATTYNVLPAAVADHFMGVVDSAISATEAQLAGYVREYVRRQVEAARHKVKEYGDRCGGGGQGARGGRCGGWGMVLCVLLISELSW